MPNPEAIKYLIIHITDIEWGTVESIRRFHMQERGWSDIGYHYLIYGLYQTYQQYVHKTPNLLMNGRVMPGRDLDNDGDVDEEIGAHAYGWNSRSLGIALVGKHGLFTENQLYALRLICIEKMSKYNIALTHVLGHRDTNTPKTCPDLNTDWLRRFINEKIQRESAGSVTA